MTTKDQSMQVPGPQPAPPGRTTGSLRDALVAAGRNETPVTEIAGNVERAVRAVDPVAVGLEAPPSPTRGTRLPRPARATEAGVAGQSAAAPVRTQLIRGRSSVKRTEFHQDPVVGWLVVVGGPGLGAFRPVFEGNNTIGRAPSQRIPLDFGDETISSEEQAYLRYDSVDRTFLLVPNLAKTNVIAVNEKKPTSAVEIGAMDLITVGRTQLAFVPFCGADFDWSELVPAITKS